MSPPVSRILSGHRAVPWAVIHLGPTLPSASSGLPGVVTGGPPMPRLGLAPGGVCRATPVTRGAGGLLHHRFTLACARRPSAVCSLWHFPSAHAAWVLPSTLPCGVRTFLDARRAPRPPGELAGDHPNQRLPTVSASRPVCDRPDFPQLRPPPPTSAPATAPRPCRRGFPPIGPPPRRSRPDRERLPTR